MSSRHDDHPGIARVGFDALIELSQDILEAHRLDGRGLDAEQAARVAVQRLPGAQQVRVRWYGPQPAAPVPRLVTLFPLGSAMPATGTAWRAIEEVAATLVRQALDHLAAPAG
jgi:hypothetical protein